MRNLIGEVPTANLHGRTLFNTKFIQNRDVENKSVLNIGCGFGWFELNLLSRGIKNMVGVDISEEAILVASNFITDGKVSFQVASALNLSFKSASFDTAVAWDVLEHLPKGSEPQLFAEVFRVLRKGGSFYLSTPNSSVISRICDPAWWLIGHRHYSIDKLERFAKMSGFKILESVVYGRWGEVVNVTNRLVSKWIFRRAPFFEKKIDAWRDREYGNTPGFTNIFIHLRKL